MLLRLQLVKTRARVYVCNMHQPQGEGFNQWAKVFNQWAGRAGGHWAKQKTKIAAFYCTVRYIRCTKNAGVPYKYKQGPNQTQLHWVK